MSGQPDTSDDLIAELAKLMATNAKPEPAPATAAKPATSATPIPIRIPGGDLPPRIPGGDAPAAPETRPAAPVIRIPGMDMPPPGAAANSSAPAPAPAPTPAPAPAPAPAPVASAPLAQPFEPKIVSDHVTPQPPIHVVTAQPISPADPDPIAALIAAELETPAAAPHPGAADAAARLPGAPPAPAKFSAQPRPAPASTSSSAPRPMPLSLAGQGRPAPATPINLKPVHTPRQIPVESDTFGVAPAAGLAKPSPRAHNDGDPMDEIESLIGEAVRVEMDRPAPVVTPVGGLAPRRTAPIEPKAETAAPRSADEAILAAAAATGAEVGVIDTPATKGARDEVIIPGGNARPANSNIRQYIGIAVAGTLLLAAAFGLYWVLTMGRSDGTVPVLTADATPAKVAPEPAATTDAAVPSSPVLNELDGVADNGAGETLVSTDQSTDTDVAAVDTEIMDSGLANRKVRTVTVRPDGTIVSGDDNVAGSEALPVTRPNVPEVPGDASAATDVLANAADAVAQDPIAAAIANPDATPVAPATDLALADPATTQPAQPINLDPSIPFPLPPMQGRATEPTVVADTPLATSLPALDTATTTGGQPLDLLSPDNLTAPPAETPAPVAETAPPPASNTSSGSNAPAYVQLSAQRDEATALADARRFTTQFASVIGNTPLEVHIVDLGAKGTWYRVLLPASSASAANTACNSIKGAGGDCLIR